jgi:lipoprotein-anchoring transpeptidase ErfK/SrfK
LGPEAKNAFSSPQKMHATGDDPRRHDGLSIFLFYRFRSRYFPPPAPAQRRARAETALAAKIPDPESATISGEYAKGSFVIINHERALYFVEESGRATRYPVAIGSSVDQWEGVQIVTAKRENPRWVPSENPLGPRALYLGDTLYRIHGTNRPGSIGGAVSHGCFRLHNAHIVQLYDKVQIGANVYVVP